ncbi:MAG: AbrB/MazE/SpoVT family DNA-binding domain-containing protein [Rhodospirillales bacterium]
MGKVTSKLQVTIPKALADKFGLKPGDEIDWIDERTTIRVVPRRRRRRDLTIEEKLAMFRASLERQQQRDAADPCADEGPQEDRGWSRDDLYGDRGRAR